MCVICVKPKGVGLPDKMTFEAMMVTNPHGFGFVTPKEVYHTMDWEAFERHFYEAVKPEDPCLVHFRIATHGSIKESNCHPFVDKALGVAFMHNGILHNILPTKDKTDSETAFRDILVPAIRKYGYVSKGLSHVVKSIIGYSKFAMMDKGGRIQMFGDYKKVGDLYFSNLHWLSHVDYRHSFKFA